MKNMKRQIPAIINILNITLLILFLVGCAARHQTSVETENKTIVYPPKNSEDLSANIRLCRKINRITGNPVGEGSVFGIKEKENLRALIEFENLENFYDQELMLHLDWISPSGRSFFMKPVSFIPNDTTTSILSSVSLSPASRQPGIYWLKVYYFRELIAEKQFELVPWASLPEEEVKAKIILSSKIDKESGMPVMVDSAFRIRKKGRIHATVNIDNLPTDDDVEFKFRVEWFEVDTSSFFKKRVSFIPDAKSSVIFSSISITPEKREAGNYSVRVFLFDELLAEKKFRLYHD